MRGAAVDQNVAGAVKATEAEILDALDFDDGTQGSQIGRGRALLVVSPEGKIAGMAIYFFSCVAWLAKPGVYLEDLFVLPEFRRLGYARLLVQAVARHAKSSGAVRIEWLCYKDNQRAMNFYTGRLGAKEMDNMTILRLEKEALENLADA